ncbi:MAG TPA: hypothetical protein VKV05_00690 [Terriglobales bacterium]|nr:hypothetical protein [Terriglobales bacterium]
MLFINRALFRLRLVETGDLATILFQVRDAERFRELLGNYSRFRFHHPGPGFMYILAFGDIVFRRLLHVCPEPANAAFLTMLLLNILLLFTAIWEFSRHCRSRLFVPAATMVAILAIYVINRANTPVATMNVWLPHMLLYVFLLFFTMCAAVGTGSVQRLPILVALGGLLIHGHAAQIFFVTLMIMCSLFGLCFTSVRPIGVRQFVSRNRRFLLASLALIAVFATPIVLDRFLHHPNNIHRIRRYLAEHRGERNSLHEAAKYELSFLTFTPRPEVAVPGTSAAGLVAASARVPYVLRYWSMFTALAILALLIVARKRSAVLSGFLVYVALQAVLVGVLFLYWGIRITGPLYNFNGFFFYSVQFALLFLFVAIILNGLMLDVGHGLSATLACTVPLLMLFAPGVFQRIGGNNRAAHPSPEMQFLAGEVESIADRIPPHLSRIRIRFHDEGLNGSLAIGVASRLHWADQPICVDESYTLVLEDSYVCRHTEGLWNLTLESPPEKCENCQFLLRDQKWSAKLEPFPAEKLPFALNLTGNSSLNLNFYVPEAGSIPSAWTKNSSVMRFLLAPNWSAADEIQIQVDGTAVQGRFVDVLLNGRPIGRIVGDGPLAADFIVPRDAFVAGHENELKFKTKSDVGVKLRSVRFEPLESDHPSHE